MRNLILILLLLVDAATVATVVVIAVLYDLPETIAASYYAFAGCLVQMLLCFMGDAVSKEEPGRRRFYRWHLVGTFVFLWLVAGGVLDELGLM